MILDISLLLSNICWMKEIVIDGVGAENAPPRQTCGKILISIMIITELRTPGGWRIIDKNSAKHILAKRIGYSLSGGLD